MATGYEDLIPKTLPPTITNPGHIETISPWLGAFIFLAILAVVLLVLFLLFGLAMKMLYLTAYSATRGVRDGWEREPAFAPPTKAPSPPRSKEEIEAETKEMVLTLRDHRRKSGLPDLPNEAAIRQWAPR